MSNIRKTENTLSLSDSNVFYTFRHPKEEYDPVTKTGNVADYFTYGVVCTEVEIDALTGENQVWHKNQMRRTLYPIGAKQKLQQTTLYLFIFFLLLFFEENKA